MVQSTAGMVLLTVELQCRISRQDGKKTNASKELKTLKNNQMKLCRRMLYPRTDGSHHMDDKHTFRQCAPRSAREGNPGA